MEYANRSLSVAEKFDLQEQLAFTLNDVAASLMILGELERTHEALARSNEMWRAMDNKVMLADNLQVQAAVAFWTGEYEQAIALAQEGRQITLAIDNLWGQSTGLIWLALVHSEAGQYGQALEAYDECLSISRRVGTKLPQLMMNSFLALTYGTLGAMERAWEAVELAQSVDRDQLQTYWPIVWAVTARLHLWGGNVPAARQASDQSFIDFKPVGANHIADGVLIADAEIALAEGRPEHALERMNELLKITEQVGRRTDVPEALLFRGLALRARGEEGEAQEDLLRARLEAEAIGSGRHFWRILLEQSRLEAAVGEAAKAAEFGAEAKAAVSGIIESLNDPELRQSFEGLPDVREALASQTT